MLMVKFCNFFFLYLYHFFLPISFFDLVSPQILPFDFGEESVNSGDLASLTCSVHKGDLPINVTWLHNNKTLRYDESVLVSNVGKKISTLSIDSVKAEHAGSYTCIAENRAGRTSYSSELFVNGTFYLLKHCFFTFPAPKVTNFSFSTTTNSPV